VETLKIEALFAAVLGSLADVEDADDTSRPQFLDSESFVDYLTAFSSVHASIQETSLEQELFFVNIAVGLCKGIHRMQPFKNNEAGATNFPLARPHIESHPFFRSIRVTS
jgi:hypothetical protein